jgi:hypothetical protein
MPSYLIETFLGRDQAEEISEHERRARAAALKLARGGTGVRFDSGIHIPEDEVCFFLFDAPSRREAELVAARAELSATRIVEAIGFGNRDANG